MCPTAVTSPLCQGGGPCWGLYLVLIETESQLCQWPTFRLRVFTQMRPFLFHFPCLWWVECTSADRLTFIITSEIHEKKNFSSQCHTGIFFPWCLLGDSAQCGAEFQFSSSNLTSSCFGYSVKVMPWCQQKTICLLLNHRHCGRIDPHNLTFDMSCWVVFCFLSFFLWGCPPSVEKIIPHYWVPCMLLFCPLFRQLPSPSAASPSWPLC